LAAIFDTFIPLKFALKIGNSIVLGFKISPRDFAQTSSAIKKLTYPHYFREISVLKHCSLEILGYLCPPPTNEGKLKQYKSIS
jgi:hypothetical protein